MDDQQLQRLTENLSMQFFHKPFVNVAKFNPRLRTIGGRYIPATRTIEINKKYYDELGYDELLGIIKHELCHYHLHIEGKPFNHRSREFKELLKKTGSPRYCKILPSENEKLITYICTECNTHFVRKRKIQIDKYRCGKCKGKIILKKTT